MPQIVIELTGPQVLRLQAAWEKQFGVSPTLTDVRAHLVRELKSIVATSERRTAEEAISIPPFDPS